MATGSGPVPSRGTLRREGASGSHPPIDAVIGDHKVDWEDRVIPGPEGAPDIAVTIFRPRALADAALPALYDIHGGGMVAGHRSWDAAPMVGLVVALGVVAVTVEYRLAPEHPYPAGVEDCYAGLLWLARSAAELGVDPERIVVMGGGAGGGLSAAMALVARDRGGPRIAGQVLLCPMLDNTHTTVSTLQYDGIGTWTREESLRAWSCVLGDDLAFSEEAPAYAAPSRATDLSGLAPAFIEVGSADPARDEGVSYASRIWAAGGQAELHAWAGGCHLFDIHAPHAAITRAASDACLSWLRRRLAR